MKNMRKVLFIMTLLMTMLSQGAWAQSTTNTITTATGSGGEGWTIPASATGLYGDY